MEQRLRNQIAANQREKEELILDTSALMERRQVIEQMLPTIQNEEDLAQALFEVWVNHDNMESEDIFHQLLSLSWIPEDVAARLVKGKNLEVEGSKGKIVRFGANMLHRIATLIHPDQQTENVFDHMYADIIAKKDQTYHHPSMKTALGLIDLTHESETHTWMKKISVLRLLLVGASAAEGTLGRPTGASEINLQQILENSPDAHQMSSDTGVIGDIAKTIAGIGTFFTRIFDKNPQGFELAGQTTPTAQENSVRLQELQQKLQETATTPVEQAKPPSETPPVQSTLPPTPTTMPTEIPKPTENHEVESLPSIFEYMIGEQSGLFQSVYAARISHLESLPKAEQQQYISSIGGLENLKTTTICMGLVGEDTNETRGFKYGRADMSHVLCYDPKNNVLTDVTIPRHMVLPENSGYDISQATWRDNSETQSGRTTPLGLKIIQSAMTHLTGMPIDGVFSFNIDSAATLIDKILPEGLDYTVQEGEGFVPGNEVLGKISGYTTGGYVAFKEGKTYHFKGESLVAFMRDRFTSEHGYYSREERSGGAITEIIKVVMDSIKDNPTGAVAAFADLSGTISEMEANRGLRVETDIAVQTDSAHPDQHSHSLGAIVGSFMKSISLPQNIAGLLKSAAQKIDLKPEIQRFSISPVAEQPQLQVAILPGNDSSLLVPKDQLKNPALSNPNQYWHTIRDFLHNEISASDKQVVAETVQKSPTVVLLGDSLVSAGTTADQLKAIVGPSITMVGDMTGSGPNQSGHSGHGGFTTAALLRDLTDKTWNGLDGKTRPVTIFDQSPGYIVIQAGTNDAAIGIPVEQTISNLKAIAELIQQNDPNTKVIIAEVPKLKNQTSTDNAITINQQLPALRDSLNAKFGRTVEIAHTDTLIPDQDLGSDGVHPNNSGQNKLVNAYNSALQKLMHSSTIAMNN
jgi:lysophospholipase L1-like esterase/anionic cell wall polymer biosynthesis LytR-Cps2A-Psr (LCP) family protein